MLSFHPVDIERELDRTHPLYVGHFFPLKGMWWSKRKQRQGLIISIAVAWYRLVRDNPTAAGYHEEEILITNLTRQLKDARVILDHFFNVLRIGFNFNDGNKSPSIITPKRLSSQMMKAVDDLLNEIHFAPGLPPTAKNLVKSEVHLEKNIEAFVMSELKTKGRDDLIPPVAWILKQKNPLTFYYQPSGKLQARDTSVWPIKAIETWPGWLRTTLFGTVIDIENSYCQFLMQNLEKKYEKNVNRMELKYPDIIRMDRDKQNFRLELLTLMQLENTAKNISLVKRLLMSLANGSNASPALMTNGSGRSEAVKIVNEMAPNALPTDLLKIGSRLQTIVKQFQGAKRDLCIFLLNTKPSRLNQKKIFQLYFAWEREARYKLWEYTGQTGLALHDGLDGIQISSPETAVSDIYKKYNLKVSISNAQNNYPI